MRQSIWRQLAIALVNMVSNSHSGNGLYKLAYKAVRFRAFFAKSASTTLARFSAEAVSTAALSEFSKS
jgi:hypothetical protein